MLGAIGLIGVGFAIVAAVALWGQNRAAFSGTIVADGFSIFFGVVALAIVDLDAMLLVAGENGIGKRTVFDDYRKQKRGGKGIITMKTGAKTGDVVGALTVRETDELMLITTKGQMVRTRVKEIRETGRNTMGVKLMDLRKGEKLQAIAPVVSQAAEEEVQSAETEPAAPAKPDKSPKPKKS